MVIMAVTTAEVVETVTAGAAAVVAIAEAVAVVETEEVEAAGTNRVRINNSKKNNNLENNSRCYNPKEQSIGRHRKVAFVRLPREGILFPLAHML
jgi:hypothetical protein